MRDELKTLEWYIEAGVDEATEEVPRDYFAASLPPARLEPVNLAKAAAKTLFPVVAPVNDSSLSAMIVQAQALANTASTLAELKAAVEEFEGCAIKKSAKNTVFADGNPGSGLMLVGEAPGADEDIKGIPFCGVSGKLLDRMLAAIGYDRTRFYITNTLFWRPPGNRQPTTDELAMCKPFVEKHIALVDPQLLVLVGGVAAKSILGTELGITRLRGKEYSYENPCNGKSYNTKVIYHPSYLLRQPINKKITWQDLLEIRKLLERDT